jgi:glutathione S-transferase
VRIFLAEKGIEVPTVQVDLGAGEHLTDAFRAVNPHCTVPVLQLDDGVSIFESTAICQYLEEAHPEPNLMGRDAEERAVIASWHRHVETDGFLAVAECLRNNSKRLQGRASTGPDNIDQIPDLSERGRKRAKAFLARMGRRLDTQPYVAVDRYTIADILLLITVDFAKWIKEDIPEQFSGMHRWHEEASARPGSVE